MPTTVLLSGLDSLSSGTAITTTNVTPNLNAVSKGTGSTVNADSAIPSGFAGNAIKEAWSSAAGAADIRMTLPATGQTASTVLRKSFYYRTTTPTPGADVSIAFAYHDGNRAFTLLQRSSTAGFRFLDGNGSGAALDFSGTYAWNTWYRIEIQADNTGGPGAAKLVGNIYNMSGTLVGTYSNTSTANLGVGTGPFNQWRLGATGYNATAGDHAFFALRWSDGGTGDIGAYLPALASPTVTLGATTNPTTVGGSNGTQVASWTAVTNATTYDAWLSTATTPNSDGSNATKVGTNVTSPYTFTGLAAGNYWYGIQANP